MTIKLDRFVTFQLELQDKIRSAALTIARMPNDEMRFLRAGERCCWPSFVQDWQAYGAVSARPPRIHPTPAAIDNMNEIIGYIAWLATQDFDEAKIVWLCFGMAHKSQSVAKVMGVHRTTVIRIRKAGLVRLTHHILGISKKAA